MSCVTSASFSVLINGQPSQLFGASRGLRQGDPLSPYLFIIMAEGLGRFIKYQVSQNSIQGWQWDNGLPSLSHLQFVDDSALAGLARIKEAEAFRHALDIYLAASGQKINEHKSSIYFFNTPDSIQHRIVGILRFQIGSLPLTYLGIPIAVSRQPRLFWQNLITKLQDKVNHWTHRWLSTAARVTLLQAVIQALPTYRCMVQAAPIYFLKQFDALSRQFLWSGNLRSTKWSLISWATVCRPKKEGGLGLRSALLSSQALAAKLYWRWCSGQHQLWARIITHKYFHGADPCSVSTLPLEGRGSMVWHTLKTGAVLVKRGLFWICKGGSQALFWSDAWDGFPSILSIYPHLQSLCDSFNAAGWDKVAHYKTPHQMGPVVGYRWKHSSDWPPGGTDVDRQQLSQILASRECSSLLGPDVLAWGGTLSGKYHVSAGYQEITRQLFGDVEVPWWKQVWNKVSWSKCNFFMWLVAHNRCLTWDNLCKRGFQGPSFCVLCGNGEESVSHMFFHCSYSLQLWHLWWSAWGCSCRHASSLPEFWARLGSAPSKSSPLHAAWIAGPSFLLWHIWLERNRRIFQDVRLGVLHLWWKILHSLQETILVKCELDRGMDPVDLAICNRLNFPLQDGPAAQRFPSMSRQLHHQRKGRVNRDGHWTPPPYGVLKINTDGSSRGNPGPAGIGGVARCSSGDVKFFFSVHKGDFTNNLMEAQAILYAVEQCCLRGWSKIICESDSQVVVNLLSSQELEDVSWQLATVVNQIILFSTSFHFIRFMYIPREWNRAADCLAKWASSHDPGWNIMDRRQLSSEMVREFDDLVAQDRAPC